MSRDNHVRSWHERHASKIMGVVLVVMIVSQVRC